MNFNRALKQFTDSGAALIGLSVDSGPALRAWSTAMGGIRHPLLADFWPHGGVAKSLGIFNDAAGIVNRTLLIIDPDGVVRHTEAHQGTLPDPVAALDKLKALQAGT